MLALFLLVFLVVLAAIAARIIVWALAERPSLYGTKNAGTLGILGVIVAMVVGVLMGVTENVWMIISVMFVACLICFAVGEKTGEA